VTTVGPGWSWAESQAAADEYQREASGLVGETIEAVRYLNLDYLTEGFRHGEVGPRRIVADPERDQPTWRHPACDSVDFAVEIDTRSGRHFTIAWETPGARLGLGLRELLALGNAFREDTEVAIWDVTRQGEWRDLVGKAVSAVTMHYERWDNDGALWCPWMTVVIDGKSVEFLLTEGQPDKPDSPAPCGNNVAVVFGPCALPGWLASLST
jgi:hypothetical protein